MKAEPAALVDRLRRTRLMPLRLLDDAPSGSGRDGFRSCRATWQQAAERPSVPPPQAARRGGEAVEDETTAWRAATELLGYRRGTAYELARIR